MVSLLGSAPASPDMLVVRSDDPPIKVWLNQDNSFRRGDRARVNVKTAEDGYLVVLRADAHGRVRVLFPLDPGDDDFVRGGETIEVRGRGDREAFSVDEREGSGLVLAARSAAPFKFDEFVRGDHWDYRVLDARDAGDDKEAALLDIVQRMTPDGHFNYDDQQYFVASPRTYSYDYDYPAYSVGVSFGWGWPYYGYGFSYGYGRFCFDPFFYDPFLCGPAYYSPFFYGYRPFFYRPFVYRPYGYGYYTGGVAIYNQPHSLFINRARPGSGIGMYFKNQLGGGATFGGLGTRLRVPLGTSLTRTTVTAVPVRLRATGSDTPVRERALPVRERNDRPVDRSVPAAREPDRPAARQPERPADRPAARPPERPREQTSTVPVPRSSGRARGWSAPAPRIERRSAASGRGGGGGGGGRRH